ncbi:TerC family protein [Methylacidimicrobium sp. B4]|uniref:TerC family protein n=1 Tax=Methylacidimicrobium sp. B4 TaxID=2796139 RepID=UPI001A8DA91B|nr:hypothetical protein [Methylacidimicrobium sp. B4]QSR83839.1 hypothetical protein MacB4_06015 [Methylacidimicrobium sp. B4]
MGSFFLVFLGLFSLLALLDALSSRSSGDVSLGRALLLTFLWLLFSLGCGAYLWKAHGPSAAIDFTTIYGIEYVLSIDNLFAFYGTFRLFGIRGAAQSQLLTLGILLAVLLRALLIWGGLSLLGKYEAAFPLLGLLLLVAAVRLSQRPSSEAVLPKSWRPAVLPPQELPEAPRWMIRRAGRVRPSARLLALLSIELADLLFALDSVPAAFAITLDPTVVFPANLCAVMGLRSLYPLVQQATDRLPWLTRAIPWILALMGIELCAKPWISIPTKHTLTLVASLFLCAFLLSAGRKGSRDR